LPPVLTVQLLVLPQQQVHTIDDEVDVQFELLEQEQMTEQQGPANIMPLW
jgi:hypothetical protein